MKYKFIDLAARCQAFQQRSIRSLLLRLSPAASMPGLALLASVGLSALALSDVFWMFASPAPEVFYSVQATDAGQAGSAVSQRHLMGMATAGDAAKGDSNAGASITVLGIVSSVSGQPGFAVISLNGQAPRGVVEGEELSPGMRLDRVAADHIETLTAGVRRQVALAPRQSQQTANANLPNGPRPAPATEEKTSLPEHVGGLPDQPGTFQRSALPAS